jgi:HAD superfamily hydrolase (TIGR01490 family)
MANLDRLASRTDDTDLSRSSDGRRGSRPAYPRRVTSPPAAQASEGRRPTRPAAFFDLDKTIIAKSSTLAYAKPFYRGGLINRRAVLRSGYAQFVFLAGGADHDQMERMRAYMSAMCTGWDVQQVKDIVAETLHDLIDPMVYAEAAQLIEDHHAAGRDVVIVSSSGAEVVEPIGELLGADQVVATEMEIADGRYTGEIASYVYGPAKAEAIRRVAASAGYDLSRSYAYSDSATDLPMLEAVGHPCAVNPDKALRKTAIERGWLVLDFHQPVSLRSRFSDLRPPRPAMAAAAVGAGAAAAGLVWLAARRRTPRPG